MKTCRTCQTDRPLSAFNKNKAKKDGLQSECRVCSKKRNRAYYKENRETQIQQIYAAKKRRIEENRKFVFGYLSKHTCVDCGESDPRVLEFDHQRDKEYNITDLLNGGYSREKIQLEIDKCEVRCANCHRRKTAIDFGWYTERMYQELSK